MCSSFSLGNFVCLADRWFNVDDKGTEKEPSSQDDHCEQKYTTFDSDVDDH
jgi:hypothetical protein